MRKILKAHQLLTSILSVVLSVFLVSIAVYAATTISTNINTAGTVTMESASTTNDFWLGNVIADDDDYLYFDASSSEYMMWDDTPGEFDFSDDLNITGVTTSTLAFWAGTGGTVNNINVTGGDLYVQNDAEIDGTLYSNWASTTSATSTDYIYIGPDGAEGTFDFTGGDLYVADDVEIEDVLNVAGLSTFAGFISTASSTVDADLNITGNTTSTNATSTNAFYAGGDITAAGEITSTGSTTASIINMTTIKFTPAATPTPVVQGECFIDTTDYQLNCYDGSAWQYAW